MRSYSNLPEEIIVDILCWLPAKSVGLCRCVSKSWRALLSRPEFIRAHLQSTVILRRESLTFIDTQDSLFCAPLPNAHQVFDEVTLSPGKLILADHPNRWMWVYASCNGLLLVTHSRGKKFVLNPITREITEVPRSPFRLDPSKKMYVKTGFGYDIVNADYKVVTISYYTFDLDDDGNQIEPDCTEMFVNVYSLKSRSWKRTESSPYDHSIGHVLDSGVFVDGCIYWLAGSTTNYKPAIVAFDLAEEEFCEVPPPCLIESDQMLFFHLAVLGGCLCLFNGSEKYVWAMKESGVQESWTKFKINDLESGEIRLLCLLGEEEVVLSRVDEKLAMYNVREGTLKDFVVQGITASRTVSFMESLVSPHALCNQAAGV